MLPAAIVCSSSGSRSVRDRSRVRRAGCLGRSFAFWRRRTTAGAAAADPRSRPIRAPECKRRRQHSCMGHAEPAQRVWQRLVAFRLSPSRFGPRRVAPGRPGSTFWARVRSAHAGRPPRSARKPASRTGRRARPGNSRSTALWLELNFTRRNRLRSRSAMGAPSRKIRYPHQGLLLQSDPRASRLHFWGGKHLP